MYRIGLTGNIATGKSTVMQMLGKLGAETIDADRIGHAVIQPGGPAHAAVVDAFGQGILAPDGHVDRARLGEIVFGDPDALARLERLTHPIIGEVIEQQVAATAAPVVVVEAIKLVEADLHTSSDTLWIVTAPRDQQVERLMQTRGYDRETAAQRIDAQPPIEAKLCLADVVIHNAGTLDELWQQVVSAWNSIPEAKKRART